MVEWSMISVPGAAVPAMPLAPRITSRTSGPSPTQVQTTRAPFAASAGVAQAVAPAWARDSVFDVVRL